MADSDSDGEFERFLQEDDDSLSPEPTARRSRPITAYSSSSASAVTAAAAALLASSKLTGKQTTKSKTFDKKKRSKTTRLTDSDEAPPSYYDGYSTGAGHGLEDTNADPYAFDMTSPVFSSSSMRYGNDDDDDEQTIMKKRKAKKEKVKTLATKVVAKSAPISMEDRIAKILQRTGSTQFQVDTKSDEEVVDDYKREQVVETMAGQFTTKDDDSLETKDKFNDDSQHSSLSDSLGVGSADFEVRLPPNPRLERMQLSLSSLDSEKFVVNRDALDPELAAVTPPRYEQKPMTFFKSEQEEDSDNDEYGDDDFELDHTIVEEGNESPPRASIESNETLLNKLETSITNAIDKKKVLESNVSASVLDEESRKSYREDRTIPDIEVREAQLYVSDSLDAQQSSIEGNSTFGYGNEKFEDMEPSGREEVQIDGITQGKTRDVERSTEYDDDALDADQSLPNEASSIGGIESPRATFVNTHSTDNTTVKDSIVNQDSKINAVLTEYGDGHKPTSLETSSERNQQKLEPHDVSELTLIDPTKSAAVGATIATGTRDSPPLSPPPPPPPADEDEVDDKELQCFALDAQAIDVNTQMLPLALQHSMTARNDRSRPCSSVNRFRQIENHVASLRFVQATGTPALVAVKSPSTKSEDPIFSVVRPPLVEPMAISFDADLLAEDDDAQREIDDFVRNSQISRHDTRVAMERANAVRESGLVLRLQQAQRQILQLKQCIQATTTSASPGLQDATSRPDVVDVDDEKQGSKKRAASGRDALTISQTAYEKLQKEIKTQDTLIAAFQKENERLMHQLKQVRQDIHYDVHEANEELRRQVKTLQEQVNEAVTIGDGSDLTSKAQYRVAVEARLEAEAHALALQEELATARLSHQQTLNEVTLELDRVKKAKVELECRYEGVDLTKVAQETQHTRELEKELEGCKKEHAHALGALQQKLDWYVENQRLLDDQDEELRRLRCQVAAQTLESEAGTSSKEERAHVNASDSSSRRHFRRSPHDIRRIQELETRLAQVEEAMRRRHPDSLSNLILASRRADEESKTRALEHDYEEKLAALSRELERAQEASETKLASFRQQQEKLVLQYRRKLKEQEKQIKQLNNKAPLSHRPASKDSAANDTELAKVRRFYTEKIKELERKWETKLRSLRKQQYAGLTRNQHVQEGLTYADSTVVIANLQRQLREQELELKQEKTKVEQLEGELCLGEARADDSSVTESTAPKRKQQTSATDLEDQVAELKAQLEDSESARASLARTLTAVQSLGFARKLNTDTKSIATETNWMDESIVMPKTEAEVVRLQQELTVAHESQALERATAAEKIEELERRLTKDTEERQVLDAQLAESQREMQSLQRLAIEAERHNQSLEDHVRRVPELEEEVLSLRRELELPRTPSMVQYRSLELKVATLEQKHKLREAELKVVLDRALTSTHLEKLSLERAHRAAIAAKNADIASFKRQLEEILRELAQLQQQSSSLPLDAPTKTHKQPEEDDDDVAS